mgnify:FL=1
MMAVSKKKIIERMTKIGVYKPEFDDTIARYVGMRKEYDELNKRYAKEGYQCTVHGAQGEKKNPLVTTLEALRRDMLAIENALGLTPGGLLRLREGAFEKPPEESKKDRLLNGFVGNR